MFDVWLFLCQRLSEAYDSVRCLALWRDKGFEERGCVGRACLVPAMPLCLFVVVQMLDVPATRLSPVEAADTLAAPVFEGVSVLPQCLR